MNIKKIKVAYYTQRYSAIQSRNIAWEFNFETWMAWWGADIQNRGRGKGKLQMGRIGDTGPYSPNNCIKITHEQNSIDGSLGKKLPPRSDTHKKNLSIAHKGKPGYPHTQETKDYLREINLGKQMTDAQKAKISKAAKNRTPEQVKQYVENMARTHRGKPKSPEQRRKMSIAQKLRFERERNSKINNG